MRSAACVLLMGGKSSRMGRDKAYLLYDSKPFWKKITDEMKQCGETYLSLDSSERAPDTAYQIILDEYAEIGPMGGIYSALRKVKEDLIFFAPCDMPTVTSAIIISLLDQYEEEYDGVILSGREGKYYPTIGVYSKRLIPDLQERILHKNYRMMDVVKKYRFKVVPIETIHGEEIELWNINTPDDYMRL